MDETIQYAVQVGIALNRDFADSDVARDPELVKAALTFLREYQGDFPFVKSVREAMEKYGCVTQSQVRGLLNVLVYEALQEARRKKTVAEIERLHALRQVGKCQRCKRTLTAKASVRRGLGRKCARKMKGA